MIFAVRNHYERELRYLHHFVAPGMVVVDGGASCGIYTAVAARLVGPSGRVLSFEPGAEAFSVLTKNIQLNHLTNVRAHCAALSDRDGRALLYHLERGPNSFSIGCPKSTAVESEEVVTRTLDEMFREEGIDRVEFIKLDTEGAEELVLRGAGQSIARSRPTIIFEVNAVAARQLGLRPCGAWELLMTWGYRFLFLTESGDLRELDEPPMADTIQNVIAVHGRQ
jgi:FkbM family methyltransferase